MESYRENLERVFVRMDQVLPDSCLLVWNLAMPLGERVTGGFLLPEVSDWDSQQVVQQRHRVTHSVFAM